MKLKYLLGVIGIVSLVSSCQDKEEPGGIPVTAVEVSPESIKVNKGETFRIKAIVYPEEAGLEGLKWISEDETKAVVSPDGTVTAVGTGNVKIRAIKDNHRGTCQVRIDGFFLDREELSIASGEQVQLKDSLDVEDVDQKGETVWTSSDETVARVDHLGRVRGYEAGEAVIKAVCGEFEATCKVTVSAYQPREGVGDFIYADGTRSAELIAGKTPVAIVAWMGDPTATDPSLKRDYPDCTHGIAIALKEYRNIDYMDIDAGMQFIETTGYLTPGEWVEQYIEAQETDFISNLDYRDNIVKGYNNTLCEMYFHNRSEWKLQPMQLLEEYRRDVKLPSGVSTWYLPSTRELQLVASGHLLEQGEMGTYGDIMNHNALYLNTRLALLPDADLLDTELDEDNAATVLYWASSDWYNEYASERIKGRVNMTRGNTGTTVMWDPTNIVRFMIAF